jgi:thiamine biosynthesis protein ThiS
MLAARTNQIEIVVNGQSRSIREGQSLSELLVVLEVDLARVAVELNRSIVPRKEWDKTSIGSGASLEIVQFVGGG